MSIKKKCCKGEMEVCDFCIHFNMFKDKNGLNINGDGSCGFNGKIKVVNAGDGCKEFYCKHQWERNMRNLVK